MAGSTAGITPEIGGYRFDDPALLQAALTHPSSLHRRQKNSGVPYERLEFLGDRVLGLIVAHWLYTAHPQASEGELARRHAALVRRETMAGVGAALGLLDRLQLAPTGNMAEHARGHLTILGDAVEALLGAIYLDGGMAAAAAFARAQLAAVFEAQDAAPHDPKTQLQEYLQGRGPKAKKMLPVYSVVGQSGPSHAPRFTIEVVAGGMTAQAEGTSKQEAEKAAATELLKRLIS